MPPRLRLPSTPRTQVVSKRVANAKSERFLKGNKKKTGSVWAVRAGRVLLLALGLLGELSRSRGSLDAAARARPARSQTVKKSLATHPLVFLFIFFIMAFSGACAAAWGGRTGPSCSAGRRRHAQPRPTSGVERVSAARGRVASERLAFSKQHTQQPTAATK